MSGTRSHLVVLGSLNTDFVARVGELPRPGQTVLGERLLTFAGGKGANQAVAAARLGARVTMVGRVGRDPRGDALFTELERQGVDTRGVARDPEEPTGAALIVVDRAGENQIAVTAGANGRVDATDVARALEALEAESMLALQLEIPLEAVARAITEAVRRGHRTILNAAPGMRLEPGLLRGLEAVVVNQDEAGVLIGRAVAGPAAALAAARDLHLAGARLGVVTLGAAGTAFCDHQGPRLAEPFPVSAVDTTAAGDAFVGALAVALGADLPPERAVRLASAAGAAAATREGAQSSLPTAEDLKAQFGLDWPD
ncbi:MAG TPA: ribokinase [Candidatus Dormibacteraeota bacterium]|nr:ribokinase [Candidatus Dormibacteraeota bacterium]